MILDQTIFVIRNGIRRTRGQIYDDEKKIWKIYIYIWQNKDENVVTSTSGEVGYTNKSKNIYKRRLNSSRHQQCNLFKNAQRILLVVCRLVSLG